MPPDNEVTFGTPVVAGSDNFTAPAPSACDAALDSWTFVLDSGGLHPPPPPNSPEVYLNSGARITFQNASGVAAIVGLPRSIFGMDAEVLDPGASATDSAIGYTVFMLNGKITCNDLGSGSASELVIHICPTPII